MSEKMILEVPITEVRPGDEVTDSGWRPQWRVVDRVSRTEYHLPEVRVLYSVLFGSEEFGISIESPGLAATESVIVRRAISSERRKCEQTV